MAKSQQVIVDGEKRIQQLEELKKIKAELEAQLTTIRSLRRKRLAILISVSAGLYEEVDKLTKKAPAETITDLMLEQVNDVIRETKEIVSEDTFVQRLGEFIPAGDNPQLRDVIIVLRQVRQGLDRFYAHSASIVERGSQVLQQISAVQFALEQYVKSGKTVETEDFRSQFGTIPESWLIGSYYSTHKDFNWEKLDSASLSEHFSLDEVN